MYSNYNYYPQQNTNQQFTYPRQQNPQVGLRGRLVSSPEEVLAIPIDFDGSVFYFPDATNKVIYTKQINIDGTSTILKYVREEQPVSATSNVLNKEEFITRAEFEQFLVQLKNQLAPAPQEKVELKTF